MDLKKFIYNFNGNYVEGNWDTKVIDVFKEALGMYYWDNEGKWFVRNELIKDLEPELDLYKYLIRIANECVSDNTTVVLNYSFKAKAFLNTIVYLGEDKVKELIKKERGV